MEHLGHPYLQGSTNPVVLYTHYCVEHTMHYNYNLNAIKHTLLQFLINHTYMLLQYTPLNKPKILMTSLSWNHLI